MKRIVDATDGQVLPNDFYDLPDSGERARVAMDKAI
jgi:hypothetical protein